MNVQLLTLEDKRYTPEEHLNRIGVIFAQFDQRTQDSGNLSFSAEIHHKKYFIKTAGHNKSKHTLSHRERVLLLDNASKIYREISHPLLPAYHGSLQTAWGTALVFDWVEGELIYTAKEHRNNEKSAYVRMKHLAYEDNIAFLGQVIDLHVQLASRGWLAHDFYDGSIIYHFESHTTYVIDLDHYHKGPEVNVSGKRFGSSRFMAPEELLQGATINEQTTVYNLGKLCEQFLNIDALGEKKDPVIALINKAVAEKKEDRPQTVEAFWEAWKNLLK